LSRDEQERLRDIREAIDAISSHLANASETTAAKEDPLLHDADIQRVLEIVEKDRPPLERAVDRMLDN
jgi:uncharacterized protein with HEPN domain